jgi:hypothetical protein
MIVPKGVKDLPDYEAIKEKEVAGGIAFHMEDMEVCTATQRGMRSLGYAQGRLSHLEEPMWHFQKYLATPSRSGPGCSTMWLHPRAAAASQAASTSAIAASRAPSSSAVISMRSANGA